MQNKTRWSRWTCNKCDLHSKSQFQWSDWPIIFISTFRLCYWLDAHSISALALLAIQFAWQYDCQFIRLIESAEPHHTAPRKLFYIKLNPNQRQTLYCEFECESQFFSNFRISPSSYFVLIISWVYCYCFHTANATNISIVWNSFLHTS